MTEREKEGKCKGDRYKERKGGQKGNYKGRSDYNKDEKDGRKK